MISDSQLMKLCLIISVAGIIALYVLAQFAEPVEMKISGIDSSLAGRNILVTGKVSSYFESSGNVFITIENNGTVKAVMFANDADKNPSVYDLKINDSISVEGKLEIYKGELEIIARNLREMNEK